MPIYEVEMDGKVYEVDAPDQETAVAALSQPLETPSVASGDIAERAITERGEINIPQNISDVAQREGLGRVGPALKTVIAPFQAIEAAMANPLIEIQKGNLSKVPESVWEGVSGQRLGEFGDVYRNTGLNEVASASLGVATDAVLTGGLIEQGIKSLRKSIVKGGDRLAVKSVDRIIKGVDKTSEINKNIVEQFWRGIDDVPVKTENLSSVVESTSKLPRTAIREIEERLGKNIDEIEKLADLRKLRQEIGLQKSSYFDGVKSGRIKSKPKFSDAYNEAYGKSAKLIDAELRLNGLGKDADKLIKINDAAQKSMQAEKIIKNNLLKSTGEKNIENAITKLTDAVKGADFRLRFNDLLMGKQSQKGLKLARKGVSDIRGIAFNEAMKQLATGATKSALFAGLVGSIGAKAARGVLQNTGVE